MMAMALQVRWFSLADRGSPSITVVIELQDGVMELFDFLLARHHMDYIVNSFPVIYIRVVYYSLCLSRMRACECESTLLGSCKGNNRFVRIVGGQFISIVP